MPFKKKGINVIIDSLSFTWFLNQTCKYIKLFLLYRGVKFCCVDVIAIILGKQFFSNIIVFNFICFGSGKKYREIIKVREKKYFFDF